MKDDWKEKKSILVVAVSALYQVEGVGYTGVSMLKLIMLNLLICTFYCIQLYLTENDLKVPDLDVINV